MNKPMFLKMIAKKALLILSVVVISAVYSCKDDKSTNENEEAETNHSVEQTTPANENVALNPAHGEPGHRCEIPVGAPLNSEANTPAIQSSPNSPVINNNNATNTTGENLNPAHGQPGHRCDLPVGAPLNN